MEGRPLPYVMCKWPLTTALRLVIPYTLNFVWTPFQLIQGQRKWIRRRVVWVVGSERNVKISNGQKLRHLSGLPCTCVLKSNDLSYVKPINKQIFCASDKLETPIHAG